MSNESDFEAGESRSSLDRFAGLTGGGSGNGGREMMIPAQAFDDLGNRALGAQAVAVHRDEEKVLQKLKIIGAAAGDDWYWRWPVKAKEKGPDGKDTGRYVTEWIEGPSIKLANDLARIYGNCDVDVRVRDLGDSWLLYARFTDFETGFSMTRPFQQRKNQMDKAMKSDTDRARDMALQVGVSKAIRNVVVNALQTFSGFAFDAAKESIVEKIGKKLAVYRTKVLERLAEERIDLKRVERVIARPADAWLAADVARVIATMKAVADGMATWDESYPPLEIEAGTQKEATKTEPVTAAERLDGFAGGSGQQSSAADEKAAAPAAVAETKGEAAGAPTAASPAVEETTKATASKASPAAEVATGTTAAAASAGEGKAGPGKGADVKAAAGEKASPTSSPAAPRLTKENIATLAGYSKVLMGAESANSLQKRGGEYFEGDMPEESTPLGAAVAQVFDWHSDRVKTRLSAVDVEKLVAKLLGAPANG